MRFLVVFLRLIREMHRQNAKQHTQIPNNTIKTTIIATVDAVLHSVEEPHFSSTQQSLRQEDVRQ